MCQSQRHSSFCLRSVIAFCRNIFLLLSFIQFHLSGHMLSQSVMYSCVEKKNLPDQSDFYFYLLNHFLESVVEKQKIRRLKRFSMHDSVDLLINWKGWERWELEFKTLTCDFTFMVGLRLMQLTQTAAPTAHPLMFIFWFERLINKLVMSVIHRLLMIY